MGVDVCGLSSLVCVSHSEEHSHLSSYCISGLSVSDSSGLRAKVLVKG